jgi:hypothetical protein
MSAAKNKQPKLAPGRTYTGADLDELLDVSDEEKRVAAEELARLEREGKVWKGRLEETDEGRRLWATPKFRSLIEAARRNHVPRPAPNGRHNGGSTSARSTPVGAKRKTVRD